MTMKFATLPHSFFQRDYLSKDLGESGTEVANALETSSGVDYPGSRMLGSS